MKARASMTLLAFVLTTGIAFSQAVDPVADLRRLDVVGPSRIDQLMKAAASGNAESQLRLGLAYQNGFDSVSGEQIGRNLNLAAKWFREAALQGNANAQYRIGAALLNGIGVRQDYEEAAMWFRKAADNKHAASQA